MTATPTLPRACRQVLSLDDFERLARRHLPRPIYAYVSGAVEDNLSLAENRRAFADLAFRPRVLAGVAQRDTGFELFGRRYSAPIGLAPMGISALSAYRGDVVLAQAAHQAGVPAIMSGSSLIRLEDVMAAAPHTWFQAYLPGDMAQIEGLLARVQAAGVQTLVITVDTPVAANRENNVRAGFSTPLKPSLSLAWQGISHPRWLLGTFVKTLLRHGMPHFENNYATRGAPILSPNVLRDFSDRAHLSWTHLAAIRQRWPGQLVVKGILTPEDAAIAREHGADGLIVSNHGGRQLDGAVAPLRVLPGIVRAVPGLPVMLDSGVRRGTDAIKALALGARCVFVGRPFNYAASVAGLAGVAHAIALLQAEVSRDMAMLGLTRLADITPDCIRPVAAWDTFPFPHGDTRMSTIPGFHIHARPAPTVSDALLARYSGFQVANVSDAMSRTTGTSALKPFHQRKGALAGRALTVRTRPGDNLMVHQAIDICGPGDVIVVDAGGAGPNAIIGEIMLALMIARGAAGIVIDGLIRDSDTIAQHSLPVYARGVSHRGPYKDGPGELHVPVSIDGMVVRPGDLVIGDGDGLLAVPPEEAEDIAVRVEAIQRVEADALQAIAEGRADRSWVLRTLRDKGVL